MDADSDTQEQYSSMASQDEQYTPTTTTTPCRCKRIHRFPRVLRGIGGDGARGRYIAPSVVDISPYHHGLPHLQKMEEIKLAAAYYLCRSSGHSTVEVGCAPSRAPPAPATYDAADPSVAGLGDGEFAAMMFLDGCFLLQYMVDDTDTAPPVLRNRMTLSTGSSIQKDIFLLENQIPWLVLDALTEFMAVDVSRFVDDMGAKFLPGKAKPKNGRWRMRWGSACIPAPAPPSARSRAWFGDMRVRRCRLASELLLSPVFLSEVTACWLVNMAALEASTAGARRESNGFVVSSYLSVLARLMDRKEDVHELRRRRLLHGALSNKKALGFFKGLGQNLRFGGRYFAALEEIDSYKRHRSLRITVYWFVYNNYRLIAAFLSVTSVRHQRAHRNL
uniref:Uncharacterized protein n=1 Tax=Setaria viridis TaxID=4556 RepID=A0A4U6U4J2_SETVI|nr:LOW QUALITY PROTEIN: hypothetical protein SEVIR_6G081300v2 [Setaria viridis]